MHEITKNAIAAFDADYNIKRQAEQGRNIANLLMLKKSKVHKDRYLTTWGDKTAFGIVEVIKRLSEHLNNNETITS